MSIKRKGIILAGGSGTRLHPITKGVLVKLISDINKSLGKTSVVVTHDVKEILEIAHYVYILAEG